MRSLKELQDKMFQDILQNNKDTDYLSHAHRISAYGGGYYKRLEDSIRYKFSTLVWYADPTSLNLLIEKFVRKSPPDHYNINFYGLNFANFLQEEKADPVWIDLAITQANLHLSRYGKKHPSIDLQNYAHVPSEKWTNATFTFQPFVRIFTTTHPTQVIFNAKAKNLEKPTLQKENKFFFTHKSEGKVYFESQDKIEHEILSALLEGATLSQAIANAPLEFVEKLFETFHKWQSYGLITDIQFYE